MKIELIKDSFHWKKGEVLKVGEEQEWSDISKQIAGMLIKDKIAKIYKGE